MDCWKQTTDGFTYGLSTAMIDYCQVILQLQQMNRNSWYNISLDVLMQQVKRYSVEKDVRQLAKNDIEQVSILILDKVNTKILIYYSSIMILFSALIHHWYLNHHVHPVL